MSDNDFFGGRRRRRAGAAFSPYSLFASGEQGVWYDPSDLTPEKVSWRRNLLTYSQDFENAAWTKSNASILSNLALYSQDFDNAAWNKRAGTSVTANTVAAPDGTTTAETVSANTTTLDYVEVNQLTTKAAASIAYTVSVYLKQKDLQYATIGLNDGVGNGVYCRVDVSNGTVYVAPVFYGTGFSTGSTTATNIGSGWYRFSLTATTSTGTSLYPSFAFHKLANAGSTTYVVGEGGYAWGAQVLPGSTAQTYTRSLATAAPIQFADPLGGTLADKLVENTSNGIHALTWAQTIVAGTAYSASIYLRADERTLGQLYFGAGANVLRSTYNLSTGTTVGTTSGTATLLSTSITAVGNSWYRITLSGIVDTTSTSATFISYMYDAGGNAVYTGNGTSGMYVFGAQLEQASTASAYQRITDFSSDFLAAFPTHALYQESTGVTPVTALGQSVGLVLDKRIGALTAVQPISITNSAFTSGSTGWSSTNATLNTTVSGQIDVTSTSGAAFGVLEQNIVAPAGALIRIEVDCEIVSGTGFIGLWTGTTALSTTFSDTGRRTRLFYAPVAVTNGSAVRFGGTATIGNTLRAYSVRASIVPGNHAIQATSAARPTLQARSNLLTYTEQFDNAAWTKADSATVTANAVAAPDGTTTADQLNIAASELSRIQQSITAVVTPAYTYSVWLRTSSGTATLRFGDASLLSTITVTSDWQRFSQVISGLAGPGNFTIRNESGGGAKTIFAWGAQLELGSTASTYQRVTTATDYADVGLPRNLTFDGVDDSLATAGNVDFATWTVGTRRNLLVNPTQFDAAGWVGAAGVTVTANATTAPDGTLTADNIAFATGGAAEFMRQSVAMTVGVMYTMSVYARLISGSPTFTIDYGNTGTSSAFTPTTDWQRFSYTFTFAGANSWVDLQASTTCTIAFWGAQLEVGSTATAFQDVGTDKVTLFSGVTKLSDAAQGMAVELTIGGSPGSFYVLGPPSAAFAAYQWRSGGTLLSNVTSPVSYAAPITNVLTGLGNIGTDLAAIRINGAEVATSSSDQGTGTYASAILFVGRRNSASLPFNGRIFQLVIRGATTDSVTVGNAERWVGQLTGVAL